MIRDANESTISSVSFDGGEVDVIVTVTVPSDAVAGTRDLVTLTATDASSRRNRGGATSSDSTTTVIPGEAPAPSPSPSP